MSSSYITEFYLSIIMLNLSISSINISSYLILWTLSIYPNKIYQSNIILNVRKVFYPYTIQLSMHIQGVHCDTTESKCIFKE